MMRALAMVCAVMLAAACLPAAAPAQDKDPSALWDSFPLDPTPTPASGERATAQPRAASDADDGPSPFVLFGLMVLAAGVGGSAVVLTRSVRRGRETAASEPAPVTKAPARKPEPARINGTPAPKVKAELETEPAAPRTRRFARRPRPVGSAVPAEPVAKQHGPAAADRPAPKPEAPKPAIPRQAPARAASLKLAPAPLPRARTAEPAPATPAEPAKPAEPAVAPTRPRPRRDAKRAAKPAPTPAAKTATPPAKRLAPAAPEPKVARAAEPQPAERAKPARRRRVKPAEPTPAERMEPTRSRPVEPTPVERAEPARPAPVEPQPVAEPTPQPVADPTPQPVAEPQPVVQPQPAARAPQPAAPGPPAAPPRPVAVPAYRPAAVPGAGAEVCRIRLRQGSSQSRFFAERLDGGPPLARSVPFRLRGGKSPEDRETVKAALGGLLAELEAEGWHAVGRGRAPWEVELRR